MVSKLLYRLSDFDLEEVLRLHDALRCGSPKEKWLMIELLSEGVGFL